MQRPLSILTSRAIVLLAACVVSLPAPALAQPRNCTAVGQNLYLQDVLQDLYYWNQYLPAGVNPVRFSSPEAYLEAVRYRPLDESFSYIASRAVSEAFYSDSQFVGFGLTTQSAPIDDGRAIEMRVAQVFPDSPAAEAGLLRGDRVISIGGVSVIDWWRRGELGAAFGPGDVGYQTTLVFEHHEDGPVEATITKRVVTIPTVAATGVYERNGVKVGYIFLRNFVQPSFAALNEAFAALKAGGVRELVLDLRYNGGGLVSVAQHLASLVGGARTDGQVLAEYVHNERNAFRNHVIRFETGPDALTLDRLIVITSRGSASASELVINGLRPFMPVILIGDTTYGKPVGQYGIDFCDKTAFPVGFSLRNADGEGDFFGGIPATCATGDDLSHQLGDPTEGGLAEALRYIETGACAPPAAATARALGRMPSVMRETGFQLLIGAW